MENLISEDHCILCSKREFDPQRGQICSLTQDKRAIKRKCPDFSFRKDIYAIDRDLKEEFDKPENKKSNAIGALIKWILIGSGFMTASVIMWNMAIEVYVVHLLPIGLFLIGFITLPWGVGIYFKGMQNFNAVEKKRLKHEHLMKLYDRKSFSS